MVACEPGPVEDLGVGLSPEVELAVEQAIDVVMEQIAELQTDEAYRLMHELSVSSAVLDTVSGTPRAPRAASRCASATCARWCRTRSTFYWGIVTRDTRRRGLAARAGGDRRRGWLRRLRAGMGASRCRCSAARRAAAREWRSIAGDELEVESIEVEEEPACTA